jgi:hypothetical protein
MAAAVAVTPGGAHATSDTTLSFQDQPVGTRITEQYAGRGVRFGRVAVLGAPTLPGARDCDPPVVADDPSSRFGNQVASGDLCGGTSEFKSSGAVAAFSYPRQRVSAAIGASIEGQQAELRAYSSSGELLATAGPIPVGSGVGASLSISRPQPDITYLALQLTGNFDAHVLFDNLTFDNSGSPFSLEGRNVAASVGIGLSATVAHGSDADPTASLGDYSARIDWGDGESSGGRLLGSPSSFDVQGEHTSARSGSFTLSVTVTKSDGRSVGAKGRAEVSGGPPKPQPDFQLAVSPESQSVQQGRPATYSVQVQPLNGFAGAVTLSLAGATGSFAPASVAAGGSSTLAVTTSTSTKPGSYPLTITGASGQLSHSVQATLKVSAVPPAQRVNARFSQLTKPSAKMPRSLRLDARASAAAAGRRIVRYEWDFDGDGDWDATCDGNAPGVARPYARAGRYPVALRVTDSAGARSTRKGFVSVTKPMTVPRGPNIKTLVACFDDGKDQVPGTRDDCVVEFAFSIVELISRENCFVITAEARRARLAADHAGGRELLRGVYYRATLKGPFRLNGLIVPVPRTVTSMFESDGTMSAGRVELKFGDYALYRIDLGVRIAPPHGQPFRLVSVRAPKDIPGVGALPVRGDVTVSLVDKRTLVDVNVELPGIFTDLDGHGLSGAVRMSVANHQDFRLEDAHIAIPHVFLGGFQVDNAFLDYHREGEIWEGGASLFIPPAGGVSARIRIAHGRFAYFGGSFRPPAPITIGPGIFMNRIDFSLQTDPQFEIGGGVGISAGTEVPTPFGKRCSLVGVDGTFLLHAEPPPLFFRAGGKVSLLCIPVGGGYFLVQSDGLVAFGGYVDVTLLNAIGFKASLEARLRLTESQFQLFAQARGCIVFIKDLCASAEVAFSDVGIGACFDTFIGHIGGGVRFPAKLILFSNSCDITRFLSLPRAAKGLTTEREFTLAREQRFALVAVTGTTGPPSVTLTAPNGNVYTTPPSGSVYDAKRGYILGRFGSDKTTYVFVAHPGAGRWKVTADIGSPPIAKLQLAGPRPPAKVTAILRGGTRRKLLSYRVKPLPGQRVRFVELGARTYQVLRTTRAARGTIRFTPGDGRPGLRRIVAEVTQNRFPRTSITVARYRSAGSVLPGRPAHVRARRSRGGLVVSWTRVRDAVRYAVVVRLSDGRRQLFLTVGRRLRVPKVGSSLRGTVGVRGLRADHRPGPERTVAVRSFRKTNH